MDGTTESASTNEGVNYYYTLPEWNSNYITFSPPSKKWCTCGQKLDGWWVYCPRCGEKV